MLLLLLGPGQVHPRKQTIYKETKWILIHIQLLALRTGLLIVLNIVQVYSLDSIAKIVLVDVRVAVEAERYRHCLGFLQAKALQMLLIVKLVLHFVQDHSQGTLDPKHHVVALPKDL